MFMLLMFIGMISFCLNKKHLLMMLLSLEFMVLSLFMGLVVYLSKLGDMTFIMIFLSFCVCEGVLGLSILVDMIRASGSDFILTMDFLW
uniref:NADH-ubiquinone oxidoreductase chain 4L n=1 Tax=Aspidiphorus orbiculatus TaxID=577441 RepID=A0A0S2M6J2_9CUCU|nr:NADH deshydrogenase subunit 4L [Aspidiphorus orbiculatus]